MLIDNQVTLSTKKATVQCLNLFMDFISDKGIAPLDTDHEGKLPPTEVEKLDNILASFYASIRKKNGEKYKSNGLKHIRYGLARHFENVHQLDIINGPDFVTSAKVFKALLVDTKKAGRGATEHFPAISDGDLKQLYEHPIALCTDTPFGLQNKVFFDIIFFCHRGREMK